MSFLNKLSLFKPFNSFIEGHLGIQTLDYKTLSCCL